jgi:predicted nucleic acid-binding protein
MLIAGVVVTEIAQGLTRDIKRIERFLNQWEMLEPQGIESYLRATSLYRLGRSRGFTLTTVDVLIAAIAMDHNVELFTLDQDFARLAKFIPLKLYQLR